MTKQTLANAYTQQGKPQKSNPFTILKKILPFVLPYRVTIFWAFLALLMASLATLAVPLAIGKVIDVGFSSANASLINQTFFGLIGVVAILGTASACRYYFVNTLGEQIVADLRVHLFDHLSKLDASYFDFTKTGELTSRLTSDTTLMKSTFGSSASVAVRNLFLFVGGVAMMVLTSPKLSAMVLIVIPIIVLPLVFSGRTVRRRARIAQDALAEASAFATENLAAVRIMQAYGAGPNTVNIFAKAAQLALSSAQAAIKARAILTGIAIFLAFASVVLVLWLGTHDVIAGRMSGGLLSQFLLLAVLAASSLGELSQVWSDLTAAAGAAGRILDILNTKAQIVAPAQPLTLPTPVRGDIVFEDVSFSYPTRADSKALDHLNLHIKAGETVALVGPSGAGKSTLLQLLLRFYDVTSGSIKLDRVPIIMTDPGKLRKNFALVPQEPIIFGTSVAENIGYGGSASRQEIIEAARQAYADNFIQTLPQGYDTIVGERGATLSGGQRQRIAIARAILCKAPVLLLDEATSALDAENETLVQHALEKLMGTTTTLVVAHRLATVKSADRILVIDEGRIVEEGTHGQLIKNDGLYARLARLQFTSSEPHTLTNPIV